MSEPRSKDLAKKPKALSWLNQNEGQLFLEIIDLLESGFYGKYEESGFVNFNPPQYRFNGIKEGGYIEVSATKTKGVKVRAQVDKPGEKFKNFILNESSEIENLISSISHLRNFKFTSIIEEIKFNNAVKDALKNAINTVDTNPQEPIKFLKEVVTYYRNPKIVAIALSRANGKCEVCKEKAPFLRKSDNTPYLEVHHLIPLSKDGKDSIENTIAICPNCHRKAHFG